MNVVEISFSLILEEDATSPDTAFVEMEIDTHLGVRWEGV